MKLKSFRVTNYKAIEDSGVINLNDLTVIIGKNESGKSSLLNALYRINPRFLKKFNVIIDWPRHKKESLDESGVVCQAWFSLEENDVSLIRSQLDIEPNFEDFSVVVRYDNVRHAKFGDSYYLVYTPDYIKDTINEMVLADGEIKSIKFRSKVPAIIRRATKSDFDGIDRIIADLDVKYGDNGDKLTDNEANQFIKFKTLISEAVVKFKDIIELETNLDALLIKNLPKFIYMDDYSVFSGSADLGEIHHRLSINKETKEDETVLTILDMAGLSIQSLVNNSQTNKGLRHIELETASKRLTSKTSRKWNQRKYKIELRIDGDDFNTYIRDDKSDTLIFLEERSKGFQWFFSFDLRLMQEQKSSSYILLLDEPGLHLHPDAQTDLVKTLEEYSTRNTIIYTSHLPFMVDLRHPERIRVVEEQASGITVSQTLYSSDAQSRFVLQAALGIRGRTSYLVAQYNLVVEGIHDYWILNAFDVILNKVDSVSVLDDVIITPTNGAPEVVNMTIFMLSQDLGVLALFDSDQSGKQAKNSLDKGWIENFESKKAKTLTIGDITEIDNSTIEDIMPASFYIQEVIKTYHILEGSPNYLDLKDIDIEKPIIKQIEGIFKKHGQTFSKGKVANSLKSTLISQDSYSDELLEKIRHTMKIIKVSLDSIRD